MQIDFGHKYAEVYARNEKGTYMVKVSFPEVGMYINGIKVVPSKNNEGEYKVYAPAYSTGKGWKQHLEFSGNSELWALISEEAIKAVHEYQVVDYFDAEKLSPAALDKAIEKFGLNDSPQPP